MFVFRFAISSKFSDISTQPIEKSVKDPNRLIEFSDLVPGRLYNITMWTVSGGVTSRALERQDRLYPESVRGINATRITDTGIGIQLVINLYNLINLKKHHASINVISGLFRNSVGLADSSWGL